VTGCSGKDNAETQRALGSRSLRGSSLNGGLVFGVGSAGRGKPRPYEKSKRIWRPCQLPLVVVAGAGGAASLTRMGQRGKAKFPALSSTTFTWHV
jgi:hypothetical protein